MEKMFGLYNTMTLHFLYQETDGIRNDLCEVNRGVNTPAQPVLKERQSVYQMPSMAAEAILKENAKEK